MDDRHSTSGYTFILSGGSIAWAMQKQHTIVLSSTEAEYMALTECVKHAQWTLSLLNQLDFDIDLPIELFTNSLGARAIASNSVYHKRTKHIDIKYHYICDMISSGNVNVGTVSMKENIVDLLMKALPWSSHHFLVCKFNIVDS